MHDALFSIQSIDVRSVKQAITAGSIVELCGQVEILIDNDLHIWADKAVYNHEVQSLIISAESDKTVTLESAYFLLFAEEISIDLLRKIGFARDVRVHIDGRFLSASRAEKRADGTWHLFDVVFTACDHKEPHWSFRTPEVILKKYFIQISYPSFCVGKFPILGLPVVALPLMTRSRSGFLLPKFSVDKTFGFGVTQEYFWEIAKNYSDALFGVHCRQKRGVALYANARYVNGADSQTSFDMLYARDWIRCNTVAVDPRKNRCWLKGRHVMPLPLDALKVHSLLRVDLSTDNQIAYDYFNKIGAIEDFYWNDYRVRWFDRYNAFDAVCINNEYINRDRYLCEGHCLQCRNDTANLRHAPRMLYDRTYYTIHPFLSGRISTFADHVQLRRDFCADHWLKSTARFDFRLPLESKYALWGSRLRFHAEPVFQYRSKLPCSRDRGFHSTKDHEWGARTYVQGFIGFDFPAIKGSDYDGRFYHYIQPRISWDFIPTVKQCNWLHTDEKDCVFPQQAINVILENRWYVDEWYASCIVQGGYDFDKPCELFPLRRASLTSNWLPLVVDMQVANRQADVRLTQQYDIKSGKLLQLELMLFAQCPYFSLRAGWVHQDRSVQCVRALFADVSSMINTEISANIDSAWQVSYAGQFCLEGNNGNCFFRPVHVLLQRFRVDYKGHCWGAAIGFEEKRFSLRGCVDTEQVYFFSLRLQSLGVFAKHFKQNPTILAEPEGLVRQGEMV